MNVPIAVIWLRRDLRLNDNAALYYALRSGKPVLPLFIFDTDILSKLDDITDKRVLFIYRSLINIQLQLREMGSSLCIKIGKPIEVWASLLNEYQVDAVYTNRDYEPYAISRDQSIETLLAASGVDFHSYKDQVIFERDEVVKDDGLPYTVFTPFSKRWMARLTPFHYKSYPTIAYKDNFLQTDALPIPSLSQIGFEESEFSFPPPIVSSEIIKHYHDTRDYPAVNGVSRMSLHLRFGTVSIRQLLAIALERNQNYVNELIWREFYQMILWHFPHVVKSAFRPEYDTIEWVNDEAQFERWCAGTTGFGMVDAGMRELNATGYMHNRPRMVVASFLTKQLLIDWRWGEAYFATKLLDYDLASNNGGWQWAAGCGTDAAPYFRIFNPVSQMLKFDPDLVYVRQWIPEYDTPSYPTPMISLDMARARCLATYQRAVKK